MIVSPVISQTNYVIGSDTIVGYTKKENRTIAIIFQDRNKLEELNFDNELIINTYKINEIKFKNNEKAYLNKDSINTVKTNQLNNQLFKETKSKNTWKLIGTGGIATTLLFVIITILR